MSKRVRRNNNKFIRCVLFKSGIDTLSAVTNISKCLRISQKSIGHAGLKDKRGITTQALSFLCNIDAEQLRGRLSRAYWGQQIQVSQFTGADTGVRVGDLYGNRFSIALRMIEERNIALNNDIVAIMNRIKDTGFINYFGLQRFGTGATHTHEIGILLL